MERKLEKQNLENQRLEQQKLENQRLEKHRLENERLEKERMNQAKLAEEKLQRCRAERELEEKRRIKEQADNQHIKAENKAKSKSECDEPEKIPKQQKKTKKTNKSSKDRVVPRIEVADRKLDATNKDSAKKADREPIEEEDEYDELVQDLTSWLDSFIDFDLPDLPP